MHESDLWLSICHIFLSYWTSLIAQLVKESAYNARDPGLIPGSGRSSGEGIGYPCQYSWASLMAQLVKNLPTVWETWVRSLDWEDPLEKGKTSEFQKNIYFCFIDYAKAFDCVDQSRLWKILKEMGIPDHLTCL